jgi:hypothetical protein
VFKNDQLIPVCNMHTTSMKLSTGCQGDWRQEQEEGIKPETESAHSGSVLLTFWHDLLDASTFSIMTEF